MDDLRTTPRPRSSTWAWAVAVLASACSGAFPIDRTSEGSITDDDGPFQMTFAGGESYVYRNDRYSVDVGIGWLITAEMTSTEVGPSLFLERPNRSYVIRSFDTWVEDDRAAFSHVTTEAGTYYILATTRTWSDRGRYVLHFTAQPPESGSSPPPTPAPDPNPSPVDAGPGGTVTVPSGISCDSVSYVGMAVRAEGPVGYGDCCDDRVCTSQWQCAPPSSPGDCPRCRAYTGEPCSGDGQCASGGCSEATSTNTHCVCL